MSGVAAGLIWGAVIVALWWFGSRRRGEAWPIPPDRPELGYRVFNRDFDCEISADQLRAVAMADGDYGPAPQGEFETDIAKRRAIFGASLSSARSHLAATRTDMSGQAICFLLDMSGSMAGRLPKLLGELRALAEWCDANGARSSVLGFTTRGWRGGFAREAWIESGRPEYPGRLCALMHVIVVDFDTESDDLAWEQLLDPCILRENVDGEALRWAASRLGEVSAKVRKLIVLSDGAPVDDATIMANGEEFLSRDLKVAIGDILAAGTIELHGVGLCYRVVDYYPSAHHLGEGESLLAVANAALGVEEEL